MGDWATAIGGHMCITIHKSLEAHSPQLLLIMHVENANRVVSDGYIFMDNLEPNPKNPIVTSF